MRLSQLEFLVALDKWGSFSRVSQELFIAQPSISVAIKNLEEELGYAILSRSNKGVVFTNEGMLVLAKAKEVIKNIEEIKKIEFVTDGDIQGKVCIGAESFFSSTLLLDAVMDVKKHYPGPKLSILINQDDSRELIRLVSVNEMSLALILFTETNPDEWLAEIERNKLYFHILFEDSMTFIVARNHPLVSMKVDIQALFDYRFVFYKQSLANACLQKFTQYGLKKFKKRLIKFNDLDSIKRFVLMTDAITMIPVSIYHHDDSYKTLFEPLNIQNFDWKCKIGWIHKKEPLTIIEEKIINALISTCENIY